MTTLLALGDAPIKPIRSILFDPRLNRDGIGEICPNRNRIFISHRLQQRVRFFGEPSCVQREHFDASRALGNSIEYNHILGAEAACKGSRGLGSFDSPQIFDQLARLRSEEHTSELQSQSNL